MNSRCYNKTEQRLYAYNDIKSKLANDKLDLEDLRKERVSGKSKDVLYRSVQGGIRLSREELQEIKINTVLDTIERNEKEMKRIAEAVDALKDDFYCSIINLKYFCKKTDEFIAEKLNCDPSTVRRNKRRLVQRIALRLYGEEALE